MRVCKRSKVVQLYHRIGVIDDLFLYYIYEIMVTSEYGFYYETIFRKIENQIPIQSVGCYHFYEIWLETKPEIYLGFNPLSKG